MSTRFELIEALRAKGLHVLELGPFKPDDLAWWIELRWVVDQLLQHAGNDEYLGLRAAFRRAKDFPESKTDQAEIWSALYDEVEQVLAEHDQSDS